MHEGIPGLGEFLEAWPLFRDPILCAVFAGLVLGYLGVFVVARRMVFVTATLTQSAGLGVALAFFAGIHLGFSPPPVVGAIVASGLASLVLSLPVGRLRISRESLLAFVWLISAGAALLVGARITQEAHDIATILFGTAVLVRPEDLRLVIGSSLVVGGVAIWLLPGLVFAGFDPEGARVQRIPARALDFGFLLLVTVQVAVSTRALGALPVFAFSVLPAIAALLLSSRLAVIFPVAAILGALSGFGGYVLAFFLSFPVGAMQTAVAAGFVVAAVPVRWLRGTE